MRLALSLLATLGLLSGCSSQHYQYGLHGDNRSGLAALVYHEEHRFSWALNQASTSKATESLAQVVAESTAQQLPFTLTFYYRDAAGKALAKSVKPKPGFTIRGLTHDPQQTESLLLVVDFARLRTEQCQPAGFRMADTLPLDCFVEGQRLQHVAYPSRLTRR